MRAVTACTVPLVALQMKGNWSHVDVDLNSLNKFEKDILTTRLSCVATSMCTTKYLVGMGLMSRYMYRPVRPRDCEEVFGSCM